MYCHLDFDVPFGTPPNQLLEVRHKHGNSKLIDPPAEEYLFLNVALIVHGSE